MYSESKVFIGKNDKGERVNLIPKMGYGNRKDCYP